MLSSDCMSKFRIYVCFNFLNPPFILTYSNHHVDGKKLALNQENIISNTDNIIIYLTHNIFSLINFEKNFKKL